LTWGEAGAYQLARGLLRAALDAAAQKEHRKQQEVAAGYKIHGLICRGRLLLD